MSMPNDIRNVATQVVAILSTHLALTSRLARASQTVYPVYPHIHSRSLPQPNNQRIHAYTHGSNVLVVIACRKLQRW